MVTAHGYVGVMGTREIAWWKRVKPTTVILSLAALLGAVEVIGSRYERLFAVPDLSLKMERQKFDVVEATELAVVVNVHNELSTEQTDIQLSAELVGSDGKVREVRLSEDRLSQLAKSSAKEVKAVAVAPMSGSYKLRVRANSKAGWLRPRKPFETTNDVEVWPEVPSGTVALKNGGQGQGVLRGTLRLGHRASNGLNCEWQIDKVPDLVFDGLFDLSVKDSRRRWSTDGKGENSVALLRWDVAAVPTAMSVLTAELVLKGPVSTDWTTVARQSSLVCRYSKEAIRNE